MTKVGHIHLGSDLLKQSTHWEKLPHGHTKGNILCSSAAKGDFRLEFGLPNDGTIEQGENETSPRSN